MNRTYTGDYLNYIGFPLGGIGAGMFNVEGTGAFSSFSLRNSPNINLEPCLFSAVTVKGEKNISRVVESQVPKHKIFGNATAPLTPNLYDETFARGCGIPGRTYGLPRFKNAVFTSRFPFAKISFEDENFPLTTKLTAWSPFTPPNADDSSYPLAYLEYTFENNTKHTIEAVYYYSSMNFMVEKKGRKSVYKGKNGFVLSQEGTEEQPWNQGAFSAAVNDPEVKVDTGLFRGDWYDTLTMLWNDIQAGKSKDFNRENNDDHPNPGAVLSVEFVLRPGEKKKFVVNCCWYVPESKLRFGHEKNLTQYRDLAHYSNSELVKLERYRPWYTTKFQDISQVEAFAADQYERLYRETKRFSDTFYATTLPDIVLEAVGSNLSILKSPTILRQTDGRLWCWEGCSDSAGSCPGSCTHVWNYAQALCHLFPELERGLRQTEFFDSQNESGHQNFRSSLPIGETSHDFHAASDGQLGGIIKVYRDFLIYGNVDWLKKLWPKVKKSMDYCIQLWDKKREGILKEPHHNTYDIEFWGADAMCSSFYISALKGMVEMGKILNEDYGDYADLMEKGIAYLSEHLYNGEYFYQKVEWETLEAVRAENAQFSASSKENQLLIQSSGPKYQYGEGCISDGVMGFWLG